MADYDRYSFYKQTFCIFTAVAEPRRAPDHISGSGSRYWFSDEGVVRASDHWGRAAKCKWRVVGEAPSDSRSRAGFAKWYDFREDDDRKKCYFIRAEGNAFCYMHKDDPSYGGEFLRDSSGTMRRIRQLRAYIKSSNPDLEVVRRLIDSDLPIWKITSSLQEDGVY